MKKRLPLFVLLITIGAQAQQLYLPGGTGAIANNPHNNNVGIGTDNPIYGRFQVNQLSDGPDYGIAVFSSGGTRAMRIWTDGNNSLIYSAVSGTAPLILNNGGNVGMGTLSPGSPLSISNSVEDLLHLSRTTGGAGDNIYLAFSHSNNTSPSNARARIGVNIKAGGAGRLVFQTGAGGVTAEHMRIDEVGNVGIGTSNPNKKLTVNGTIYGKEVQVDLNIPGPDYVFEDNYKLPSLEDVRTYVTANKHLPEVPSASEMQANGINVGEMNMILLKKVEELTLYLIDQQKRIEKLEAENLKLHGAAKDSLPKEE